MKIEHICCSKNSIPYWEYHNEHLRTLALEELLHCSII